MIDQLACLTKIAKGKVVKGTYQGIPFQGMVTEVYPSVVIRGRAPISFTVELAARVTGIAVESGNSAVFYSADTRAANDAVLALKSVSWAKTTK